MTNWSLFILWIYINIKVFDISPKVLLKKVTLNKICENNYGLDKKNKACVLGVLYAIQEIILHFVLILSLSLEVEQVKPSMG